MLTGKLRFNGEKGDLVACLLLPPLLTASPPAWGGTAQEPGNLLDLVYFLQQCLNALQVSTFSSERLDTGMLVTSSRMSRRILMGSPSRRC